jgi:uncharacterized membrane protein
MLGQWVVLLHVISAFAYVAGVVGGELTRTYAWRQEKVEILAQLYHLSRWFDLKLVSPGSHMIVIFGLVAAWLRGWPILGVLQGSPVNWVFVSLLLYLSLFVPVFLISLPRGKILRQRLADAQAQGIITPELRASINDLWMKAAYAYQNVVVPIIIYLMVMKPI